MSRAARCRPARNAGFTLAELLAVLVIAAIVMGLVIGAVGHVRRAAYEARARADLERIRAGVEEYVLRAGAAPGSLADIAWAADSRLSLDASGFPVDPWGAQYVYSNNGARAYVLYSTGETTNDFDDVRPGID